MKTIVVNDIAHHWSQCGDLDGAPVFFSNALGTDMRIWDGVISHLPKDFRYVRYDTRGHGLTDVGPDQFSIDDLATDAERLIEDVVGEPVVFIGLCMGGMIGQALAARRPDLVKALVISNSATIVRNTVAWEKRMAHIRADGMISVAESVMDLWFGKSFRKHVNVSIWRAMLERTPTEGYLGCSAALADANLKKDCKSVIAPTLCLAGEEDLASPPQIVSKMRDLIKDSRFKVIPEVGHLPSVQDPKNYASYLAPFLQEYANA